MGNTLLIGATSGIAEAVARRLAGRGERLFLAARDRQRRHALAMDLAARGAGIAGEADFEAGKPSSHAALVAKAWRTLGRVDLALLAHGSLGDQRACEADAAAALREFGVNAMSVVSLGTELANRFEAQGSGCLAVIGSVAGDRGRQSNYVYGASKAAVAAFAQGLRNRLHRAGVRVLTVKPGFVDTPMTAHLPKGPLFADADTVARGILKAVDGGRDVAYLPWFWGPIMAAVRALPEPVFKRMRL